MKLLIPINTSIRRTATGAYFTEQDMFYEAIVKNNTIYIGELQLDETQVREAAANNNQTLLEYLRKGITSDPTLYTYCIKHRVGYTPINTYNSGVDYEQVDAVKVENKRWLQFLVRILRTRKDGNALILLNNNTLESLWTQGLNYKKK